MKLIKAPFSPTNDGAELAPALVVKELESTFINESGRTSKFDVREVAFPRIFEEVSLISDKAILVGGSHCVTYPSFKGFVMNNPGAGIIIFDAHPDCDSKVCYGDQKDLVIMLLKQNIVPPEKIIIIGMRNWSGEEREFLELNKVRYFNMKKIYGEDIHEVCDTVMESARLWPFVYVSVDFDVLDPAFAPGVSCPEPGGMSSRELIYFLQRLNLLKNVRMFDITEINPKKDRDNLTVKLGAKIIKELI